MNPIFLGRLLGLQCASSPAGAAGCGGLLGLVLLGSLAVLLLHVLNLHGEQLAVLQRGLQGVAGVLGVYVGLDDFVVVHHHHAVADGLQEEPQVQGVLV